LSEEQAKSRLLNKIARVKLGFDMDAMVGGIRNATQRYA